MSRNEGGVSANGGGKAERYNLVLEDTTPSYAWKGSLGRDSPGRAYDPDSGGTFICYSQRILRPIVREPSKRLACILSHGRPGAQVDRILEPVKKLKVE